MNGLMYVAPALAATSAWGNEKHRVQLVSIPSSANVLIALIPSRISGTLTTTLSAI